MMITVEQALATVFRLVRPVETEFVDLSDAAGRVLASPVTADRDQPPFAASVMDGYAVRSADVHPGATLRVIGEAAAGHAFDGALAAGTAVRIFTGAPVPAGADRVVIQEDTRRDGDVVCLDGPLEGAGYVRPAGADFAAGDQISAPRVLRPADLALLAAMNVARVPVFCRPDVALIATGDELVMPGETPGASQIIASNCFGLKAMFQQAGANVRLLPIARDTEPSLRTAFAMAAGADLIVTVGGASVGDHDLVAPVARDLGMNRAFYKIAMRPGKPLMAGTLAGSVMIGLPGNPVSSMVCGQIFILPVLRGMQGLPPAPAPRKSACLSRDLATNGQREHYMRARVQSGKIEPHDRQDSALLSVLSTANALLVRPAGDGPRKAGETVEYVPI